ncbi:MAG: PDZ domain-containing protein [Propionivibrio sp.]|nr:PDZ domain-containing protein [Propionivibrio sp.]
MLRKTIIVACASLVMLSGCVTTYEHHEAFQPKLTETGGPKELYSIRNEQVTGLFTPGMTKAQITERFGNPAMAGSGVDKEGKPNSWTVYTYFRGYSHVDTNFNTTIVNRSTSAGLTFDSTDKLIDVSFSRYQKFSQGAKGMRDATEEEVARYLGAPQVLDIKPASVVAGKTTTASPAATPTAAATTPAGGWKLGAEISELRSELANRSGFKGRGVYVVGVTPQGLAAVAGVAAGDVIVKINGVATPTRDDLIEQLKAAPTSSALNLQIFSRGRLRNVTVPAQQSEETTSI